MVQLNHITEFLLDVGEQEEKVKGGVKAGDYEYLLSMPIGTLTFEKVEQLRQQRDKMEDDVETLKKTMPKSLWERDLDTFINQLDVCGSFFLHWNSVPKSEHMTSKKLFLVWILETMDQEHGVFFTCVCHVVDGRPRKLRKQKMRPMRLSMKQRKVRMFSKDLLPRHPRRIPNIRSQMLM